MTHMTFLTLVGTKYSFRLVCADFFLFLLVDLVQCHITSESHQRKILLVAESPEKYVNNYSAEFQRDFMKLLSSR